MNIIYKRIVLLITVMLTVFTSCNSDLEVNAPYKDIAIVYGLLNQADSTHYIKINKAFLGQADANDMAQIPDSSDYGDILDVKIVETKRPQGANRSFSLQRILMTGKESGMFYSPDQYVYKFETLPAEPLSGEARYELYIKNKNTEKEITSQTEMINDFSIKEPKANNGSDAQFWTKVSFVNLNKYNEYKIKWISAKDARRYNVVMSFNYIEEDINGTKTDKKVEWKFSDIKSKSAVGGEEMEISILSEEFYSKIGNEVAINSSVKNRIINGLNFNITAAGEELNIYMEVNEPATGIVQEKPEYTNITNGIGIFSCRYNKDVKGKLMTLTTIEELVTATIGGHTSDRGFCDDSPGSNFPCNP